jgi:hypothetical protein
MEGCALWAGFWKVMNCTQDFLFFCNDHISLAHRIEKLKLKQFPRIQFGEGYAI